MFTKATSPAVGDWVQAVRYCSLRATQIIRFSCFFYPETQTGYDYLQFTISWYNGSTCIVAGIRWKRSLGRWEYRDANNTWQPIEGGNQTLYGSVYHYLSFVFNFKEKTYKEFQCDSLLLNNLSLPAYSTTNTTSSYLSMSIELRSAATLIQKVYFDDILLEEII